MTAGPYDPGDIWHSQWKGKGIGYLITHVRRLRGHSQPQLAELLCTTSGVTTLTRHEISRWERHERVPTREWLGWISTVLGIPLDVLKAAAAITRQRRIETPRNNLTTRNYREGTTADRPRLDSLGSIDIPTLDQTVSALRRIDDLMGGADAAAIALARFTAVAAAVTPHLSSAPIANAFAQMAQVTSWVLTDAGCGSSAIRICQIGLRIASQTGNHALMSHILGCLAETSAETGDIDKSLQWARAAVYQSRKASPNVRVVALHRAGYTQAIAGLHQEAQRSLALAQKMWDHGDLSHSPPWLYWLTDHYLVALTGRCHAALGHSHLAKRLLTETLDIRRVSPRARAICGAWLGLVHLALGDHEAARVVASMAFVDAIRSGSVRAARRVRILDVALRRDLTQTEVHRYIRQVEESLAFLPDVRHSCQSSAMIIKPGATPRMMAPHPHPAR